MIDFFYEVADRIVLKNLEPTSDSVYFINGRRNSILSFTTTIHNDAGQALNGHGVFRCGVCNTECHYRNLTLFVVGGPPTIDSGNGEYGCICNNFN